MFAGVLFCDCALVGCARTAPVVGAGAVSLRSSQGGVVGDSSAVNPPLAFPVIGSMTDIEFLRTSVGLPLLEKRYAGRDGGSARGCSSVLARGRAEQTPKKGVTQAGAREDPEHSGQPSGTGFHGLEVMTGPGINRALR